jgi:hypothetical protein
MDFWKALGDLQEERKRLTRMITSLEAIARGGGRRRGRKAMSEAERRKVSERMQGYWAARRAQSGSRDADE